MECIKFTEFFLKIGRHSEEIHRSHSCLHHMTRICNRSFIDRIINRAIITNCEIDKLSAAGACSPCYITVTRLYLRPIEYTCRHMRNMFLVNKRGKREEERSRSRERGKKRELDLAISTANKNKKPKEDCLESINNCLRIFSDRILKDSDRYYISISMRLTSRAR